MSLATAEIQAIVAEHGKSAVDTGSSAAQIALLTADINKLTAHFKTHNKDKHSRRGLMRKVNLRRNLLKYLKATDLAQYQLLITKLELRG